MILVTPGGKFYCHAQVIITRRDQGRKVDLEISRVSTYYDSNIIGRHRISLLPYEGRNKDYKPDIDTYSKPDIDSTKCTKYLLNDPLNLNIKPPGSNLTKKYNGIPIIPPKYINGSQPGGISCKDGSRTDESHLISSQKDHYS